LFDSVNKFIINIVDASGALFCIILGIVMPLVFWYSLSSYFLLWNVPYAVSALAVCLIQALGFALFYRKKPINAYVYLSVTLIPTLVLIMTGI
jgi:hypothetical protein